MAKSGRGYAIKGKRTRRRLRLEPLESRTLLSADGWSGTVLHDSAANLFTVDVDDGMALHYVGNTDVIMSDMAFSPSDELYGVTLPEFGGASELYRIDVDFESPSPTVVANYVATMSVGLGQGIYVNSLEFNEAGELFAAGYDQQGLAYLFQIDPDTAGAERVLALDFNWSAGDLAFDADGNLYLTTSDGFSGGLLRITPELDSFEVVGADMSYDLYGLTHGPTPAMYGFRAAKEVYQINPANGQETLVTELDDPQLSEVNGAATVFSSPTDLEEVDFRYLPGAQPTLGELWYRVVPAREGLFTVALDNVDPDALIDLNLYQFDDQGKFVELPTKALGEFRLDYENTVAGAEYFVEIDGAEPGVDVRVANLFELSGNGAVVYGTQQDDTFEFTPGPPYTITINGVDYQYNFNPGSPVRVTFDGDVGHDVALLDGSIGADVVALSLASSTGSLSRLGHYEVTVSGTQEISFDGRGGKDSATLTGSNLADAIALEPKSASVEGLDGTLQVTNVPTIRVDGGADADSATFTGTLANETVDLGYLEGEFGGTGFLGSVSNVESITAIAGGGYDVASLSDSPGREVLRARPSSASLKGTDFSLYVSDFDEVSAHATLGGNDVAHLVGTAAGRNTFKATPDYAILSGAGYANLAESFRYVYAYGQQGSGGTDVALLFDQPGSADTLRAWPDQANLSGAEYYVRANSFRYVHASATTGDDDVALLYDQPGSTDTFRARPDQANLYSSEYYVRANSFRYVHASATPGHNDVALLYDQPGSADTFRAWPHQANLQGPEYYVRANSFRYVHASATPGYDDVALLYDQPGSADTLRAWPHQANLQGSEYYVRASSFRYVHASATPGYDDVALLYDQPGSADTLRAWPDQVNLYGSEYYVRASLFRHVQAFATLGEDDVAHFYDDPFGFDTFEAWPDQVRLYGTGYEVRAQSFRRVYAYASRSGGDAAILHDSALADYLEAADEWAELYDAAASFFYHVSDFDNVTAISSNATGDVKILAAVDYSLDPDGNWEEP